MTRYEATFNGVQSRRSPWATVAAAITSIAAGACAPAQQSLLELPPGVVHWVDGDSGTIDGVRFRLADVDAPETQPVGSRGGAKCASEIVLGRAAELYMKAITDGRRTLITHQDPERDFSDRIVVNLSVDGRDVGESGIAAGHLRPDLFEKGKRVGQPIDWCK